MGIGWNKAVGRAPCLPGKAVGPSSLRMEHRGCEKARALPWGHTQAPT